LLLYTIYIMYVKTIFKCVFLDVEMLFENIYWDLLSETV